MGETLQPWGRALFGGPWSTVWPLLLLPVFAHALLRPALNRVETMWGDPRWQTRAAAAGAVLPALVALCVAAAFSLHSFQAVPESILCIVKFYGPASIAALFLTRALVLFQIRSRRLSRLIRLTRSPGPRLARLAHEVGVPVRELASDTPVCFASGILRPCVVVSSGVLDRLGDGDVRAALVHERAHLQGGDNLRALLVTILSETALVPATKALRLYRRGREALADREAVRHVERTALAGALVSMTRMVAPNPLAASFAGPDGLEQRVRLLLGSADTRSVSVAAKREVFARMAIVAALGLYPLAAPLLHGLFCHHG